ncbi:CAP domain-containing protein [Nocardia yamanashiensis]|uniref:CAP domain-containing protein n=1 Tax=Nocardia yamanashiensis TaxID=209247 RepID=UPI001E5F1D7F|nr:CAP domain-containing protein [Nocardia yamanashiensis]UGT45124.1 CAP domain-containing protein [Nocardia yamanashiensis]
MRDLVAGGVLALPGGVLTLRVPGPFDLSVVITGANGKVSGDADFVFYNQPAAPGVRLSGNTVTLDRARLRPGAARLTLVASPETEHAPLARPTLTITGNGLDLRFTTPVPVRERAMLLAEVYRRDAEWRIRALGQGYDDGLAGVARDFGVVVTDPGASGPGTPTQRPPDQGMPGGSTPARHAPGHGTPARHTSVQRISGQGTPAPPASGRGMPDHVAPDRDIADVIALTNAARAAAGLPPLTHDPRLSEVARAHSADMIRRGYFAHTSPEGAQPWDRTAAAHIDFRGIAENIAWGQRSAREVVDGWMNSPGHRANILLPDFTHIGVGRAGEHWTQLFGAAW